MKRMTLLALVCLTWAPLAFAYPPSNPEQTIVFVQKLQTKSGGFLLKYPKDGEKPGEPTLRATSSCV